MKYRRIDDVVRLQLGTFRDAGIPEPMEGKKWLRFPCPFCHGDRASISYEVGVFQCFHADCRKRFNAGKGYTWAVARFLPQIEQAVRNARVSFSKLLGGQQGYDDAWNFAAQRVAIYAGEIPPTGRDSDAGQLDEWEEQVKGDPDQLDRFVLRALNMDMLNYGRDRLRRNKRETPVEPEKFGSVTGYITTGNLDAYPVLRMRYAEGKTREQIAGELKVPLARVKRMLSAETKRYVEEHGIAA
jgi:hypothetical protein